MWSTLGSSLFLRNMQNPFLQAALFSTLVVFAACGGNGKSSGVEQQQLDDPNIAFAEIDERIVASPQDPQLFAQRAKLYEDRDSLHLALNDWNRALSLDSTNAELHIGIGDLYFRGVRMADAERHFRKAATLDPASAEARLKIAEIKLLERGYKDAMGWANDALRIDQQNAQGYFLKGWIHMEGGDTALAVSSYRTAVEQDPSMQKAYVQLGVLHAAVGDPLAMQYYNSALELDPTSTETLYALGMYAQDNGMDSLALHCYDRIKQIAPENVLAWYNTGYVLLENMDRPDEARSQFTRAISLAPLFVEAYYNRGITYEMTGALDSAYVDYRQALAIQPDYSPAAFGMGRLQDKGLKVGR